MEETGPCRQGVSLCPMPPKLVRAGSVHVVGACPLFSPFHNLGVPRELSTHIAQKIPEEHE